MGRDEEGEILRAYGESLALVRLHHQLLQLSPYDAVSREAWFDAAKTLLATATNASEGVGWANSSEKEITPHWDCFLWP